MPQSINPLANDDPGDPSVPLDPDSLTLRDAGGNPVASVTLHGQGVYTINGSGRIVFTPEPDFTGTADSVDYRVADVNGTTATSTYTPTVTPVAPEANPDTTSGPQGRPQSVDPLANDNPGDPSVPLDPDTLTLLDGAGDPVASVTVPSAGLYTINGSEAKKVVDQIKPSEYIFPMHHGTKGYEDLLPATEFTESFPADQVANSDDNQVRLNRDPQRPRPLVVTLGFEPKKK